MYEVHNRHYKFCMLLPMAILILLPSCVVSQQWSENYAVMDESRSNDPLIIDGNIETVGKSQIIRKSGNLELDLYLPSESIILLPEKKTIFRVVIHSSNLKEFQLMARNSNGGWDQFHEHKGKHQSVFDIRIRPSVLSDAIKLVVRSTTNDGAQKRANLKLERENEVTRSGKVRRGQKVYKISGPLKAPAKIAEMELYGLAEVTP